MAYIAENEEDVRYDHGYKFVFTYGDKDFGEILKKLIIADIRSDIDNNYTPDRKQNM